MNPSGARGIIGGTTTICAQQQRQPSPAQPSSESWVVWDENKHAGDAIASHAKISVAARSSKKSETTRRNVDQYVMRCLINDATNEGRPGAKWPDGIWESPSVASRQAALAISDCHAIGSCHLSWHFLSSSVARIVNYSVNLQSPRPVQTASSDPFGAPIYFRRTRTTLVHLC
jgi:hypothetical protein